MKNALRLPLLVALVALGLVSSASADENLPSCKNHYILSERCQLPVPTIEWQALPDSLMAHGFGHTATLLGDGRLLVVGGGTYDHDPVTSMWSLRERIGAETYDPPTGAWLATPPLNHWRLGQAAVRLLDGRVLVVGGDEYGGTAELFDPASGSWSPTGTLIMSRACFTADLLPDGKVLVAGGFDRNGSTLDSAELWDPQSGHWKPTASLAEPRGLHVASALPDGRVLLVGGMTDEMMMTTTGSAEVFDPATQTWSRAGSIDARWLHSATLTEDGEVLVTGGYISRAPGGIGMYQASEIGSTSIYSPNTGTWRSAGELGVARHRHMAVPLSGQGILVFGGAAQVTQIPNYSEATVERAELFGRSSGAWNYPEVANPLPTSPSNYHSATPLADGTVLFIGDVEGRRVVLLKY